MPERRIDGRTDVKAGKEFGDQISAFRERYDSLLSVLGQMGTEVLRNRTLETDPDIPPYKFVRFATHDFIFPPQPEAPVETAADDVPDTHPYTLRNETVKVEYDDSLVEGYITVKYDDSGDVPHLIVRDGLPEPSELPVEVAQAIEGSLRDI